MTDETPAQFKARTEREQQEAAEAGAPWPDEVVKERFAAGPKPTKHKS